MYFLALGSGDPKYNPILLVDPNGLEVKNGQEEERNNAKNEYESARKNYIDTARNGNRKIA